MTTEEGNKLIAEFMGGEIQPDLTCNNYGKMSIPQWAFIKYNFDTMRIGGYEYHTSWDWLMPVVEKIDGLKCDKAGSVICQTNTTSHSFYINYNDGKSTCYCHPKYYDGRHREEGESRIENVWQAVVKFIQWYNQNKQP